VPWSINEALDVVKWIVETHGGNDDHQAWRQICAYIAEAEKPSHNSQSDAIALLEESLLKLPAESDGGDENACDCLRCRIIRFIAAQQHT